MSVRMKTICGRGIASPRVRSIGWLLGSLLLGYLAALPGAAAAQSQNQITLINPASALQGTTGLLVTFTLDTDSPPAPPAGVMPTSVMIGTMSGTSVTHASQYIVTALFSIPAQEPAGAKDTAITFPVPGGGTLVFSKAGGFTVLPAGNQPPSITQHPQSQTIPPGGSVTFSVTAYGTEPLRYQWQKDDSDIYGATATSHVINPVAESDAADYRCVVTNDYGSATSNEATLTVAELPTDGYPVVDTGQIKCYSDQIEITCPQPGQAFYGQDSQCRGRQSSFSISGDGRTVQDAVTGLTWQRSPDTNGDGSITATDKLTWTQAQARPAVLNNAHYGGFNDWRLPTIKELYSLIDFRGTDPSGMVGDDTSGLTPFIDTNYFGFAYGQTSVGERIIDSQYASSNLYVGPNQGSEGGKLFGVNFADGRIKGYGLSLMGSDKTFFVQCVRGNTSYGINNYVDNGDGTITDRSSGLMWSKGDNGAALTWQQALAWAQTQNAADYLGHDDWRLPNAKELQSILDYTRAPDAVDSSHRGPACDPIFTCTQITNEACAADYPWYWAGTTHGNYLGTGTWGIYVCFGRSMGYMGGWADVHGAGSQRSDPKSGSLSNFTHSGCGYYNGNAPQGDAIRISNYVRLVRNAEPSTDVGGDGSIRQGSGPSLRAMPNPTAGNVVLSFVLPSAGDSRVAIYSTSGRFVRRLAEGVLSAGAHQLSWAGTDGAGRLLPAGAYFVRLESAAGTRSQKITITR
jgi:hypothetical protein